MTELEIMKVVITLKTKTLPVDKALIYVYERVSHEKPGDAYCTVFLKNLYTFLSNFMNKCSEVSLTLTWKSLSLFPNKELYQSYKQN